MQRVLSRVSTHVLHMFNVVKKRAMSVLQGQHFQPVFQQLLDAKYKPVLLDELDKTAKPEDIKVILVAQHPRYERLVQLMRELPNLKAVVNFGVGVNHIDVDVAKQIGIKVSNTPDCLSAGTADLAFAILLAAARNVVIGDSIAKHPSTEKFDMHWLGTEVNGSVIGIVGMGRIGFEIAKRARGFDMEVVYHNRHRRPKEEEEKVQASFCSSLVELLSQSDFVVAVVPATEETKRMFKIEQFAAMKKTAIFVNICRGTVVDHDALTKALEMQQIAGKHAES